jgi:hypothetical protein
VDTLLEGVDTAAEHVVAYCDGGYTTNLPLEDVTGGKAWIAYSYELEAISESGLRGHRRAGRVGRQTGAQRRRTVPVHPSAWKMNSRKVAQGRATAVSPIPLAEGWLWGLHAGGQPSRCRLPVEGPS